MSTSLVTNEVTNRTPHRQWWALAVLMLPVLLVSGAGDPVVPAPEAAKLAAALRSAGATSVGCANLHGPVWPASDDDADVGASKLFDAYCNGMFLEPMLLGRYPADLAPLLEDVVRDGDLATIRQPLAEMGAAAAQMLGELIDGSALRLPRIELSTELIVRESAAPAP